MIVLKKISLACFFIGIVTNSAAGGTFSLGLSCKSKSNTFLIHNTIHNITIGDGYSGFNNRKDCRQSIKSSKKSICNWNGNNYQPHSVSTGNSIGSGGFSSFSDCTSATENSSESVCNWNGNSYQPYRVATAKPIGKPNYGMRYLSDCIQLSQTHGVYICNWDGKGYSTYDPKTNDPLAERYESLSQCVESNKID